MDCSLCGDQQWLRLDVPATDPRCGEMVPCSCLIAEQIERQCVDQLGRRLARCTFDTYQAKTAIEKRARRACDDLLRNEVASVLLHGRVGAGKTHLLAATVREGFRLGGSWFYVVPDLAGELKRHLADNTTEQLIYDIQLSVGILALDDLGAERGTEWIQEILYRIVNFRYNHELPTIISSNVHIDMIDMRLRRRLMNGVVINFG